MDRKTGAPLGPALRHGSTVVQAAFSPDRRRIVTASDDNTARVWDSDTGQSVGRPLPHKGTVLHAEFSPDNRRVITASEDHTARVWDAATGEPLTPPLRHPQRVVWARFSRDGRWAITRCQGQRARSWDLTPDARPQPTLSLLAQVLTGSRISEGGGLVPLSPESLRAAWKKLQAVPPPGR
jgi:WD40 repeat protein